MDCFGEDKVIVDAFVEYLRQKGYSGLKVEEYPDRKSPNDIDAIAGMFAIEHTSVDSIPNQREHSAWFEKAVGGLEKDDIHLPFRLMIEIPYDGIRKKQTWSSVKSALKHWVANESKKLSEGRNEINGVPGVPFSFAAKKV